MIFIVISHIDFCKDDLQAFHVFLFLQITKAVARVKVLAQSGLQNILSFNALKILSQNSYWHWE